MVNCNAVQLLGYRNAPYTPDALTARCVCQYVCVCVCMCMYTTTLKDAGVPRTHQPR